MKNFIANLDQAFENRVRLGIMSVLLVGDRVDFNALKEILDVSDGNLASHMLALEKAEYVVEKQFPCKKPKTTYSVTRTGKTAFTDHLYMLEKLIGRT